ncbi:MAG: hypothetical protein KC561_21445, partial [Myxococcales bacterium]|nr:hypothetical protein [Myxococcales bacterium]
MSKPTESGPVVATRRLVKKKRKGVAPSESHDTRVAFRITCSRCKKDDTLPFVPKTLNDVLCKSCATEVFGDDWAHGRQVDDRTEYQITCEQCGRTGTVPFAPDPERERP